jgi:molecular chaperone DnaK (HSP70)
VAAARMINGRRPTFPADTPEQLADLAKRCWAADPNKRPGFREIVATFADSSLIGSIPGLSSSSYGEYQDRIKIDRIDTDAANQTFAGIAAESRPLIGIDLGTTYSSVGCFTRRGPEVIRCIGGTSIPSTVAFQDGRWMVGHVAADLSWRYPTTTIYDMKRMLGCSFDMPAIQAAMSSWPFHLSRGDGGEILIDVQESDGIHQYHPYELIAKIIGLLMQRAEAKTGERVSEAVISVPACFNDSQREDTMKAAEIAGLKATLVNESAVGAIADELAMEREETRTVLVFNFGGGTLDLVLGDVAPNAFTVRAVSGDAHLGGRDFDEVLMRFGLERFDRRGTLTVETITKSQSHLLRMGCEAAKRKLSHHTTARIIARDFDKEGDLTVRVTRGEFEAECRHLLDRLRPPMEEVLRFGGIRVEAISEVILIGGSSSIPAVRRRIEKFFHRRLSFQDPLIEGVAEGATIIAGKMWGRSRIPRMPDLHFQDICPLSIGLRSSGGRMKVFIPAGTKLPATVTKRMRNDDPNKVVGLVHVYEGLWRMTTRNPCLAEFRVEGHRPADRGSERLELTFTLDSNRILAVSAAVVSRKATTDLPVRKTGCLMGGPEAGRKRFQNEADQEDDAREWDEATARRASQRPPENSIHELVTL